MKLRRKFSVYIMPVMTAALAIICGILTVGIIVYKNGGIFTYYGDYNCQQIDFYMHAHEMVTSGNWGWDWTTDLGVNFIGSYSFYLLFSPFFWLTLPFSTDTVPYLMAPLFVLKFTVCALTSYFYLERFIRDKRIASLGSLLYAFSGWCIYNVFFNHFLDVAAFFPLILIGIEKIVTEEKHGFFAFAVAINAMVNYWFFIGEVVFTILYFCIRITDKKVDKKLRKFSFVAFESVLGLGLAAFAVVPSVLAIIGNPRTGSDSFITGWNMWLYYSEQRFPAIITSFLFPPDLPAKQNMFPDQGAQWASMAGWLPLFGLCGVLAYIRNEGKTWITKMIIACSVFALVPVLNSLFILFNNSYYARWFYMFDLILALATCISIDRMTNPRITEFDFKKGLIPIGAASVILALILYFTPTKDEEGNLSFGITYNEDWFTVSVIFAAVSLALCFIIWYFRNNKQIRTIALILTAFMCASYGATYVNIGYGYADDHEEIIDDAVGLYGEMNLPDDDTFVRSDFYECFENLGLYWNIPSIRCFHSIVPVSTMEFYPTVGTKRDVSSKPDYEDYALRSLLSVKYLFADSDECAEDALLVAGFGYYDTLNGYNIYSNENYIPMGFTYDYYITEEEFEAIPESQRSKVLLSALVLSNSQILRYSENLTHLPIIEDYMSYDSFKGWVNDRRLSSSESFTVSSDGFTSTIILPFDNLVFFSVPYESGWKAYVNGIETSIEKVDTGFMAVYAKAGANEIVFKYETPGLKIGIIISVLSGILIAAYLIYFFKKAQKEKDDILMKEYYENQLFDEVADAVETASKEDDLTVIRKPEETPPYKEYDGPEEKLYPEL